MPTTIGILAHVDAGKTTLAEALLHAAGTIRAPGRVDKGTALLDHGAVERERGITVFTDQASFPAGGRTFHLLDTPGHADFSGEMERALWVLDCAVLVVSGVEGVQSHTRTLWRLLEGRGVPTLVFLNKADRPGFDAPGVLAQLSARLSGDFLPFDGGLPMEGLAELDEDLLERYLDGDADPARWSAAARRLFLARRCFPVLTGSALTGQGVEALLDLLPRLTAETGDPAAPLRARAYKVRHDKGLGRLTFLKILSGTLSPRQELALPGGGTEKADRLLGFQGGRSAPLDKALPGDLCAVSGLQSLKAGQELGGAPGTAPEELRPALSAKVLAGPEVPPHALLKIFKELEDEEPLLAVRWDEHLQELQVRVMGPVQLEVLAQLVRERYGCAVSFGPCQILYQETVAAPVVGRGHFEPLRHYAEVHLLISPGPRGSGVAFESRCPLDELASNWQNLIRSHVLDEAHFGVLTGSPLTDVEIALLAGRDHLKHTEGGDFRQAVRRAVRQGLMGAENLLLEPWYAVTVEVDTSLCGRVLADLQRMGGVCRSPEAAGDRAVIRGRVPVSTSMDYPKELAAFSHGGGSISLTLDGYEPCRDQAGVVERLGYDPERDTEQPAGSVFCSHGAGHPVPWDQAPAHMHLHP